MTPSVIAYAPRRGLRLLRPTAPLLRFDEIRDRTFYRRVYLAWGLLFLNVVPFYKLNWNGQSLIVPIPGFVGRILTQGALPLALALAISVNRRLLIRPNVALGLATLLVITVVIAGVDPVTGKFIATAYRTCRLAAFIGTLWLLTPWWGRRDLLLVKCQLATLLTLLGTVVLGLLVAPGRALSGGRLSGEFWPITPVQVSDYCAVTLGMLAVLWFCGETRRRLVLVVVLAVTVLLLMTHTRTEILALLAGLLVAGLRMFTVKARVRRLFAAVAISVSVAVIAFSSVLTTWLIRGENTKELTDLTGRTNVWTGVLNSPRDRFQLIFGYGLSNKGFNGLPIDSTWLAAYYDLGLVGIGICISMLLFVLVTAYFRPRSTRTALALFLVTYLMVISFTETGISDASPYLVEFALAASLLTPLRSDSPLNPPRGDPLFVSSREKRLT